MPQKRHILDLSAEIRISIYRHLFSNFVLQLDGPENLVPFDCEPNSSVNQICRVNKQMREESVPILASSLQVICSPKLFAQDDIALQSSQSAQRSQLRAKPEVVTPKLNRRFLESVRSLSISLSSIWIPDPTKFPQLRKIAVDAWLSRPAITEHKDDDLVDLVQVFMRATWQPDCCYPNWLKDVYQTAPNRVCLAIQGVWTVEEKASADESHLKALVNLRTGKVEHREMGGRELELYDVVPAPWLYH